MELYYQTGDGGEITSIPLDQIPSFDTTRNTPITLNTAVNYDPNAWTITATPDAPYLRVDGNGIASWWQNVQPGEPYVWSGSGSNFTYPIELTRHADPKPEPVDTHELDEFIDSLKVAEGEDDV